MYAITSLIVILCSIFSPLVVGICIIQIIEKRSDIRRKKVLEHYKNLVSQLTDENLQGHLENLGSHSLSEIGILMSEFFKRNKTDFIKDDQVVS